jgi:hypothetical protein
LPQQRRIRRAEPENQPEDEDQSDDYATDNRDAAASEKHGSSENAYTLTSRHFWKAKPDAKAR